MPTPTKGARLGGSPAHEKLILANLATELFRHGKIKTTESKARRLRRWPSSWSRRPSAATCTPVAGFWPP